MNRMILGIALAALTVLCTVAFGSLAGDMAAFGQEDREANSEKISR